MSDLNKKIEKFVNTWMYHAGNSANKALADAIDYTAQNSDMEAKFSSVLFKGEGSFSFTMTYETPDGRSYWQFIEHGVDGWQKSQGSKYKFKEGGGVPIKALKSFVEKRNIKPTMNIAAHRKTESIKGKGKLSKKIKKGLSQSNRDKSLKSMLFAMSKSIKRDGLKARPFVKNILTPELMNDFRTGLAQIYKEEFIIQINKD